MRTKYFTIPSISGVVLPPGDRIKLDDGRVLTLQAFHLLAPEDASVVLRPGDRMEVKDLR
jgi:hypothetical protein